MKKKQYIVYPRWTKWIILCTLLKSVEIGEQYHLTFITRIEVEEDT